MSNRKQLALCVALGLMILLNACGGSGIVRDKADTGGEKQIDVSAIPDAIPRDEPKSKYGNPESYAVFGKRHYVLKSSAGFRERGIASWYGSKFHGRRTSSGEIYDMYKMTAAHKNLPLPTYVEVTNVDNNKKIIVKVNDRGPFYGDRIIDLSYVAATKLGIVKKGTGNVVIRALTGNTETAVTTTNTRQATKKSAGDKEAIYIQVGAFSDKSNASALKTKLAELSAYMVTIRDVVVNGRFLSRVLVGPIFHIDVAGKIVTTLDRLGVGSYKIVTD